MKVWILQCCSPPLHVWELVDIFASKESAESAQEELDQAAQHAGMETEVVERDVLG